MTAPSTPSAPPAAAPASPRPVSPAAAPTPAPPTTAPVSATAAPTPASPTAALAAPAPSLPASPTAASPTTPAHPTPALAAPSMPSTAAPSTAVRPTAAPPAAASPPAAPPSPTAALDLRVAAVEPLSPQVLRFRFERPDGAPLPPFSGGAHVVVEMPDGAAIRRNPYSLISDPHDVSGYEIAVRRDDAGRGGSRYMHARVAVGDRLRVGAPVNLFALDLRARRRLMIAGGIGITPFLAQIRQLDRLRLPWELHYAARSRAEAAALTLLPRGPHVHVRITGEAGRPDIPGLLAGQPLGTHVYACGPAGMVAAVEAAAAALGWPAETVHSEAFRAPPPGRPFAARLARSGIEVEVGAHQSLLEAMEAAGVDAPWLCRGGACGRCETAVLSCEGRIEHHDHWLDAADRAAQDRIMPCVSRFAGAALVLDR